MSRSRDIGISECTFSRLIAVTADLRRVVATPSRFRVFPIKFITYCNLSMPTDIPYAADAELSLSYDELNVLKEQYYKEIENGHVSTQSKFNYAWGLVKSPKPEMQTEGIKLLQEIYSASPSHRRECAYYIALGYFKLNNYEHAKRFNDMLLSIEPQNMQAQSLRKLIDNAVTREGYIGVGLAAGAVAVAGVLAAALFKRAGRR